jgi:hypothetical protein
MMLMLECDFFMIEIIGPFASIQTKDNIEFGVFSVSKVKQGSFLGCESCVTSLRREAAIP